MSERVYIAGPMTGLPEFNYPAFFAAAKQLEAAGHAAINPARTQGREDCNSWLDFMRASLLDIAACDGICTLPGWGDSRGAALEVFIAKSLGLPVRPLDEWLSRRCLCGGDGVRYTVGADAKCPAHGFPTGGAA